MCKTLIRRTVLIFWISKLNDNKLNEREMSLNWESVKHSAFLKANKTNFVLNITVTRRKRIQTIVLKIKNNKTMNRDEKDSRWIRTIHFKPISLSWWCHSKPKSFKTFGKWLCIKDFLRKMAEYLKMILAWCSAQTIVTCRKNKIRLYNFKKASQHGSNNSKAPAQMHFVLPTCSQYFQFL